MTSMQIGFPMSNPDRYLEDVPVGEVTIGPPITISEAEIISFGRAYDPQPFHTDPVAAASSQFGSLIASGWHVAALAMKQLVESRPYGATPVLGMGVDELRWLHPVRPGDRLTVRREIVSSKRSTSRPDRGVLKAMVEITNQQGVTVMRFTSIAQVPTRAQASPRP
jgi:acyl dehydratase